MKYSIVALALAALAQAQTRADIPTCALSCLDDAVRSTTKCEPTDYTCVCQNTAAVQTAATPCVISKCGADVALNKVLPASQAICKNPAGAGGSASGSSSSSAAAAAGTTTAAAATTSAAAATTAAASAPPSSVASAAPSSAPASSVTSAAPAGNGTSPSSPTKVPVGNGAAGLVPGLALLALGALAL